MTAQTLLAQRPRTPTSAFSVSMWHIPGGHRYDQATLVVGFFETEEAEEARTLCAQHTIPEMPLMLTIADHDLAVDRTLDGLAHQLKTQGNEMPASMRNRILERMERIQRDNLRTVAA